MAARFMPDWVLGFTCGYISFRFVTGNIPLQSFTNKYASLLSAKYADASSKKLLNISQEMLYFMATFESENHMGIVKSYMFNCLCSFYIHILGTIPRVTCLYVIHLKINENQRKE